MWYFSRPRGRHARTHRRASSPRVVESLEGRTMLSASAAGPATGSSIPTSTILKVSPSTIETAQTIALTATVENSVKNIPINIGKVKFVVESPKPFVLKTADLDSKGQAAVVTDKLTKIGPYLVDAKYIPNGQRFAQSVAAPVLVTVNPLTAVSFLVRPDRRYWSPQQAAEFHGHGARRPASARDELYGHDYFHEPDGFVDGLAQERVCQPGNHSAAAADDRPGELSGEALHVHAPGSRHSSFRGRCDLRQGRRRDSASRAGKQQQGLRQDDVRDLLSDAVRKIEVLSRGIGGTLKRRAEFASRSSG